MIKQDLRKTSNSRNLVNALLKAFRILTMKIVTTFYRRVIIIVRSLDDPVPDLEPRLSVMITSLTEKDLPAYNRFRPDQSLTKIQGRFANGDRCFAVWHEGQIVHAAWVTTKRKYESYFRRELILQPGDIFLYDHYTLPSYRSSGLAQARGAHVLRYYQEEGYHRSVGIIAIENKAAFGPGKVFNYRPIGMYSCIRLGPWQWNWQQAWTEEPLPILTKSKPYG
jgi:GNAT superfamily N-acetyltransferase